MAGEVTVPDDEALVRAQAVAAALVGRYAQLADSGRFDELMDLFTEDAVVCVDDREPYRGRKEVRSIFTRSRELLSGATGPGYVRHNVASIVADAVRFDEIAATSYFTVVTAVGVDHWGRYRDRIVLDDGQWRFASRRVRVDGSTEGSWHRLRDDP